MRTIKECIIKHKFVLLQFYFAFIAVVRTT